MGAIVGPLPRGGYPLSGGDHRGVAYRRDQLAMASGLEAEHTEAAFLAVERDPLYQAREDFDLKVRLFARHFLPGA